MLKEELIRLLGLYMGHNVRLLLGDGTGLEGEFAGYTEETVSVSIDGEEKTVSLADVEDIRYKGKITEYHADEAYGKIDLSYRFDLKNCENSEEEKNRMRYHEFMYSVVCHLALEKKAGAEESGMLKDELGGIIATDVLLEDNPGHYINIPVLEKGCYIFTFRTGEKRIGNVGRAQNAFDLLYKGNLICKFVPKDIAGITKCPEVNECVIAETEGGLVKGLVTAVKEDGFFVYTLDGTLEWVGFSKLIKIRYQGVVEEATDSQYGKWFYVDGKYYTKQTYLQDWVPNEKCTDVLCKGTVVSYELAVAARGVIAKDICIERKVEHSRIGIILATDPNGNGWIGVHYNSLVNEKGDVHFNRADFPKDIPFNMMKYIYVVKYSVEGKRRGKEHYEVASMEVLATYDRLKTGEVHVDKDGNVTVIPFFYTIIEQYMDREVCVLWKEEGKQTQGRLVSVDEGEGMLTILCGSGIETKMEKIAIDAVDNIRIIGYVTTYYENGTGYIDSRNYFNIKNVKNAMRYSSLEGKRVSFLLRRSSKGDGTDAIELEVLEDEQKSVAQLIEEKEIVVLGQKENAYKVMDAEDYEEWKNPDEVSYDASFAGVIGGEGLDFSRFDYPATVQVSLLNGKVKKEIKIRGGEKTEKRLFGYLNTVKMDKNGKRYGFIVKKPEELRGIYCYLEEVGGAVETESFSLYGDFDTMKYYYPVLYTVDYLSEREPNPAKFVKILGKEVKQKKYYRYGFLTSYKREEDEGKICDTYAKGKYGSFRMTGLKALGWTEPVNTANNLYFVTYEVNNKGEVSRIVSMERITRSQIVSATVENGKAVLKKATFVEPENATEYALVPEAGETIVVYDEEQYSIYEFVERVDESHIRVRTYSEENREESILDCDNLQFYRVGVLSGADDAFAYVYINGYLKVAAEKLEGKTARVYKNDKSRLMVFYRVGMDGTVEEVTLPEEQKAVVPWTKGRVIASDSGKKELKLICGKEEREVSHYFFVGSDSAIPRTGGEGTAVYARVVKCSPGKTEDYKDLWIALEVRCEFEKLLVAEYAEAECSYCVKRGKLIFPVTPRYLDYWKKHKDQMVDIRFKPQEGEQENTGMLVAAPKRLEHGNPYVIASKGDPLKGGDEMFKGRKDEKDEIWKYIIKDNRVVKGRRVILYGQKRCGKSSLADAIVYDMQESEEINNHTIIIQFSALNTSYEELESTLCLKILSAVKATLGRKNKLTVECKAQIKKYQTSYSWDAFTEVVEDFFKSCMDYGIVLLVDECTGVTTKVLEECKKRPEVCEETSPEKREETRTEFVERTLGVITKLADIGITQIYIGHANMKEAMTELGLINGVEQKSDVKCLTAFSKDDAEELIEHIKTIGIGKENPYEERAEVYMRFLSGGSPYVLMNMCKRMFDSYKEKDFEGRITYQMVEDMASEYCKQIGNNQADTFDPILSEVGDSKETEKRIKELLVTVAKFMGDISETTEWFSAPCEESLLERELQEKGWTKEQIDDTMNKLTSRKVIERDMVDGKAYCRVIMGLYVKYVKDGWQ